MKEYLNIEDNFPEVLEQTVTYDLEERTYNFAKRVRELIKSLPKTITNIEDISQLTRCSGSVGANYIEANDSISRKDFGYRIKICRKEAKESKFFLRLVDCNEQVSLEDERKKLIQEAQELVLIFASILRKTGEIK